MIVRRGQERTKVGETARSPFERSMEHQSNLAYLNKGSYMLSHYIDKHDGEDLFKNRFALKVIQFTRTSFDRQILESVLLQENLHHHLLNSKSEYNRCAIPRLSSKLGEQEYKKYTEEEKEEEARNKAVEQRIRGLRKEMNRRRRDENDDEEEIKETKEIDMEIDGSCPKKKRIRMETRIQRKIP